MRVFKKYVKVIAICDEEGKQTPLCVVWLNGHKYAIDKILETRQAASEVGGCGILYRCLINNKERKLFYEVNRWFIESPKP
ncbi:hypothetical protein [Breznakia pachnodae]|uniref:Uncharacterized protein n=1 Tax=Breznakia pachnodae TaxID=265178 RepID=A0ABU0E3V8_9FIRM|nr:hypothetical protein [Breznakia pachnodae]MDQ0361511.1 hypothetical protein [Breznakia pachnodae]